MKSAKAAIEAKKNVLSFPGARDRREKHELAFLPAALEIVETPPSPIGRSIGATIIALFCLALIWASFGHVDIVASAPGKIVPSGRVKLIQPFETGVVRAIHIHDGQSVKAGDVLIELDPTMTTAEQEHIKNDLVAAQLDIARLRAALSDGDDPKSEFHPPAGASPALVNMQREFLAKQIEEHRAKLASLDRQRAQKEAERDTIAATIEKLDASSPLIQQRVDIRKYLADKELGSRLTYLETLQQLTENEKDLVVQQSRLQEADAAIAAITESRAQADAEFHRTLFGDLAEAERKAGGLADDLAKGGAAHQASASNRTGRRCSSAALGAYHRRRGDAGAAIGRSRAGRCRSRSGSHGLEQGHRLRTPGPGRPDQGRHVQLYPLRAASRPRGKRFAGCHGPRNSAR